jgi:hypothetical protein
MIGALQMSPERPDRSITIGTGAFAMSCDAFPKIGTQNYARGCAGLDPEIAEPLAAG